MQSKMHSFIESAVGVAFGYTLSVAAGVIIYPLFDSSITLDENMGITLCFTLLSLARTYITRRLFNWLHTQKVSRAEG